LVCDAQAFVAVGGATDDEDNNDEDDKDVVVDEDDKDDDVDEDDKEETCGRGGVFEAVVATLYLVKIDCKRSLEPCQGMFVDEGVKSFVDGW
jgi:hypothetical protein